MHSTEVLICTALDLWHEYLVAGGFSKVAAEPVDAAFDRHRVVAHAHPAALHQHAITADSVRQQQELLIGMHRRDPYSSRQAAGRQHSRKAGSRAQGSRHRQAGTSTGATNYLSGSIPSSFGIPSSRGALMFTAEIRISVDP